MSEHEDLIGVYGAIDRAVAENLTLASQVAPFLGAYRDTRAIRWFDEFEAWNRELGTRPFPDLEEALENLAGRPAPGRTAARRILALTVAGRVFPELTHADASVSIQRALAVEGLTGPEDTANATELVSLLMDPDEFPSLEQWAHLLETAVARGLLPSQLRAQADAPPCSGTLVEVPPGDLFPAAELTTTFSTTALTLQQATRFLEPSNWPGCCPFWCVMQEIGRTPTQTRIYHEIVSLDCTNKGNAWTAETYLEFALINMKDGARVSYALSDPYRTPNDLIVVDEGSLTVEQQGPAVRVSTVKRIKFNHPFTGPALAMIMCALGYNHVAEDLVFNCAAETPDDPDAGTAFPGKTLPKYDPAHHGKAGHHAPAGSPFDSVVADAMAAFTRCAQDYATAYSSAYDKMQAGSYRADDLVAGMAEMWSRYMRDGAVIADLAMRTAQAARRSDREPATSAAADDPMAPS
jgi:hypothetical protein